RRTRMRKIGLSFGLWLLLLLAQHGAVLHEISHICRAASTEVTVQAESSADQICELCLGYSQLAHSVAHCVPALLVERIGSQIGTERPAAAIPVDPPTPRSRGPPASRFDS